MKVPLLVLIPTGDYSLLLGLWVSVLADYTPIQLVAPSAVTMAVATDAMICTMNLNVSLLLIILLLFYPFTLFSFKQARGFRPKRLIAVVWQTATCLAGVTAVATTIAIVAILIIILRILDIA